VAVARGLRRPPYRITRSLAAWALTRRDYLRGRLLLAGTDPDSLSAFDWVNVAEAALIEPFVHGGSQSVDEALKIVHKAFTDALPLREHWGESEEAQQGLSAAEAMFPRRG